MKKKSLIFIVAISLSSSMLFSSCIGSFALFNKLLDWNRNIDSKWINELVFLAFTIVPVYGISMIADFLVINSIEFWSGTNPVADAGTVKNIETEQGTYAIETKADGYTIQKDNQETVDLKYDATDNSWNVEANGESHKLFRFAEDDEVVMYLPDGQEMNVSLNEAGIMAFQQVVNNNTFFAAR